LLILITALLAVLPPGYGQTSDADRERWERVPELFAALGLKLGDRVADIGAGDGFYTARLARVVGPSGRVIAVDIDEQALARLRKRLTDEDIHNADVIRGAPDDPHLEAGTLDAALIYNSYHEMAQHQSMLSHIYVALKPGGKLTMVESAHRDRVKLDRAKQVAEHEIALELVEAELRQASFEIAERREKFIEFTDKDGGGFWLMTASKPIGIH
jgi:FkbM family methyltransferase